jgi:hypothetical protein
MTAQSKLWGNVALSAALVLLSGCAPRSDGPDSHPNTSGPPAASQPSFEAVATVQELMQDEIDPAADSIWDSVGTITTRAGTVEKRPQSDEEWQALRRSTVVLIEATNLLAMPGRQVSAKDFPSDGPGVLSSREIQRNLTGHENDFNNLARSLRIAGRRILAAVDARDPAALQREGEVMDAACEACHVANWYPHEIIPPMPAVPPTP